MLNEVYYFFLGDITSDDYTPFERETVLANRDNPYCPADELV